MYLFLERNVQLSVFCFVNTAMTNYTNETAFIMFLLCRFTSCLSFYSILNELSDYAGQREVVAEEMGHKVYGELMRYSQELKAERKHVSTLKR